MVHPHRTLVAATPDGRWKEINSQQLASSPTPIRPATAPTSTTHPGGAGGGGLGGGFNEGSRVLVKWGVTEAWYPATISKAHVLDGVLKYDIVWDQGKG